MLKLQESQRAEQERLKAEERDRRRGRLPRLNAEVLLMFALGKDRADLYAHSNDELDQEVFARYDDALTQRARRG
ncbi:MAG TPA: hypothetical protein VH088_19355 [Terriglobales bacterium]|nr:hypothetical protein [Terriglobales bacterium]